MTATIVMADDGVPFDGRSLDAGPLGGTETAFIGLAEGLASRGHRVAAFTRTAQRLTHRGVDWTPIGEGVPDAADLYIANRGHRLLGLAPRAGRVAFWLHNPARYVLKRRYLWPLWRRRPAVVFGGVYHASTLPHWVPTGGRHVVPLGIGEAFRRAPVREPPRPHAIFTSNPLRRLDWVLERWAERIHPALPQAELHIYSSLVTYGAGAEGEAAPVLARARALAGAGVRLMPPVAKPVLAEILTQSRLFLYGGDPGETFCLAAAEAQASGVPAVVARSTCLAERVIDGETGFVLDDDDNAGFAGRAILLLADDELWTRQHRACLATRRGLSWTEVAAEWEKLLP